MGPRSKCELGTIVNWARMGVLLGLTNPLPQPRPWDLVALMLHVSVNLHFGGQLNNQCLWRASSLGAGGVVLGVVGFGCGMRLVVLWTNLALQGLRLLSQRIQIRGCIVAHTLGKF